MHVHCDRDEVLLGLQNFKNFTYYVYGYILCGLFILWVGLLLVLVLYECGRFTTIITPVDCK